MREGGPGGGIIRLLWVVAMETAVAAAKVFFLLPSCLHVLNQFSDIYDERVVLRCVHLGVSSSLVCSSAVIHV